MDNPVIINNIFNILHAPARQMPEAQRLARVVTPDNQAAQRQVPGAQNLQRDINL